MSEQSTETELALLKQWRATAELQLKDVNDSIQALQDERTKALKWGITVLGAAVLAMASWIWSFVFKGVH